MPISRLSFVALVVFCVAVTFALFLVAVCRDPTVLTTFPPPCVFRKATGIYCPGCGSTRALRALAGGDFAVALRCNPATVAFLFLFPFLFFLRRPKFRVVYYRLGNVADYLILNILATLFCCLPFGVAGIIFSVQANSAKARGDIQGAVRASSTAKTFLILSAVCGALLLLLSLSSFVTETADATRSVAPLYP